VTISVARRGAGVANDSKFVSPLYFMNARVVLSNNATSVPITLSGENLDAVKSAKY